MLNHKTTSCVWTHLFLISMPCKCSSRRKFNSNVYLYIATYWYGRRRRRRWLNCLLFYAFQIKCWWLIKYCALLKSRVYHHHTMCARSRLNKLKRAIVTWVFIWAHNTRSGHVTLFKRTLHDRYKWIRQTIQLSVKFKSFWCNSIKGVCSSFRSKCINEFFIDGINVYKDLNARMPTKRWVMISKK